jgi:hypothetical protein
MHLPGKITYKERGSDGHHDVTVLDFGTEFFDWLVRGRMIKLRKIPNFESYIKAQIWRHHGFIEN